MTLNFGQTLTRAWEILWRHKVLWIFGILSGCATGRSGGGSMNVQFNGTNRDVRLPPEVERFFEQNAGNLPWIVAGVVCGLLLITLLIWVIGLFGRGGLIGGIRLADTAGRVSFGEALAIGTNRVVPLILTSLLIAVPFTLAAVLLVLIVAAIGAATLGIGLLCLIPLLLLLIPIGIGVILVSYVAQLSVVVDNCGPIEAVGRSWAFLRAHLWDALALGLVIFIAELVVGLLLTAPLLVAVVPLVVNLIQLDRTNALPDLNTFLPTLICGGLYLPVLILLDGVLRTWTTAAWTLAYERLSGRPPQVVEAA